MVRKYQQTKEEQLEWVRKYMKLPENIEKTKLYQQKNREKLNERARTYRQENRDYYNAKERERNKSPESIAYRKAYYLKTKGAI